MKQLKELNKGGDYIIGYVRKHSITSNRIEEVKRVIAEYFLIKEYDEVSG